MKSPDRAQSALEEFRPRLAELLGENLESIVLYGSRARGDCEEDSDIDLLCIMRGPFDYGELMERTSRLTAEISLKYDVVLSRAFVTRNNYESRRTPFLMNVCAEGLTIWERTARRLESKDSSTGQGKPVCSHEHPTESRQRQ